MNKKLNFVIFLFSIIFFLTFNISQARIKLKVSGVNIATHAVVASILKNGRLHADDYTKYCTSNTLDGDYLCSEQISKSLTTDKDNIDRLHSQINLTHLDSYSQYSVDNYNSLVNRYNYQITQYNNSLASSCVDIFRYCKDYELKYKTTDESAQKQANENFNSWSILILLLIIVGGAWSFFKIRNTK